MVRHSCRDFLNIAPYGTKLHDWWQDTGLRVQAQGGGTVHSEHVQMNVRWRLCTCCSSKSGMNEKRQSCHGCFSMCFIFAQSLSLQIKQKISQSGGEFGGWFDTLLFKTFATFRLASAQLAFVLLLTMLDLNFSRAPVSQDLQGLAWTHSRAHLSVGTFIAAVLGSGRQVWDQGPKTWSKRETNSFVQPPAHGGGPNSW